MRFGRALAGACALLSVVALPSNDPAGAATPTKYVTGWVPSWSSSAVSNGVASLGTNAAIIAMVSPFSYSATGASSFRLNANQLDFDRAVTAARTAGIPVVPSITDGTGKLVMSGILQDQLQRTAHVNAIVGLVLDNRFDGIDLDYEGFAFTDGKASWTATAAAWQAFVEELARALPADKVLSITVPPIWAGGVAGYTVYRPKEILPFVDRLQLMVYDWSVGSAGPVAPMWWVRDVINTMSTVGPSLMSKVQIGVPTYGRSWVTARSGTCPANASLSTVSVLQRNAKALADSKGVVATRDDASGEMKFTYQQTFTGTLTNVIPVPVYTPPNSTAGAVAPADPNALAPALRLTPPGSIVTCVVTRTVYYPDAEAVAARAKAAIDAGTAGIAIWALGYETPETWARLQNLAP